MSVVNRLFSIVLIGTPIRLFSFTKVTGREYLPEKGGFVVASNHQRNGDPFVLAAYMWQFEFRFLAKHTLWEIPKIGKIVGIVLTAAGQIPLHRTDSVEGLKGLDLGIEALEDGKVLGIFPEGTKSPDGKLYRGKTGIARILYASGVGVQPVARILSGKLFVRDELRIGPMIHVPYIAHPTAEQLRTLTDQIMAAIQALSGQEYVDTYIQKR